MAKKIVKISTEKSLDEIRDAVKKNNLIIGTNETIKFLKLGKIAKIFLTTNVPAAIKEDIENYSKISKSAVESLNIPNKELGIICKKQYSISVVSIPKGA